MITLEKLIFTKELIISVSIEKINCFRRKISILSRIYKKVPWVYQMSSKELYERYDLLTRI